MADEPQLSPQPPPPEEPPPFGGSWRRLYVLVVAWLAVQVVLYALFAASCR